MTGDSIDKYFDDYFHQPRECDKLWRYINLAQFLSLLENETLYFTSIDNFSDPFEGSIPFSMKKKRKEEISNLLQEDNYIKTRKNGMKKARSQFYVNCWHAKKCESAEMWKLYAEKGITIQSTFQLLKEALNKSNKNINIYSVQYMDFENDEIEDEKLLKDPRFRPFLKRKTFEYEKEVRALFREKIKLEPDDYIHETLQSQLEKIRSEKGKYVKVYINTLIKNIYVSPYVEDWIFELVKKIIKRYDFDLNLTKSTLAKSPEF